MNEYRIKKEFSFREGERFETEDGLVYTVTGKLGRGAQGEVYRVSGPGGEFALKWYHDARYLDLIDAEAFKRNLTQNVVSGPPRLSGGDTATQFIWPLRMIKQRGRAFGYLMNLFPTGFEPMKNVIMLEKQDESGRSTPLRWHSWFTLITAGLNLVRAFEILHASGLSYQDINDGGVSINMATGDVFICDCDNVSPDKTNLGIRGVMNYMAPEVVRCEKLPDRNTDEYSLAVMLFRLFFRGHPMHGEESRRLHNSETMSQREADLLIYGYKPHYCLASYDNQNRASRMANPDVYNLCFNFPLVLMDAFEQVFTEGVQKPASRLTATEWRKVLLQVRDSLVLVNGAEAFYNLRLPKPLPPQCRTLCYDRGRKVLCMPGKVLYKYHLDDYGADFRTPVGRVVAGRQPDRLSLINESGAPIGYELGDNRGQCLPGQQMLLLPGMRLKFERASARVE